MLIFIQAENYPHTTKCSTENYFIYIIDTEENKINHSHKQIQEVRWLSLISKWPELLMSYPMFSGPINVMIFQ